MTPEESGIMRDAFYFLRDHINPPPLGTDECAAPLATCVLMAIYGYLDWKCKQSKGEDT